MIDERFPNWDIDVEKGTIWSILNKKYLGCEDKDGYLKTSKYVNGKIIDVKIHRVIWMVANQCEIPKGYHIHHIDGNKFNNSIYNLILIQHSEHSKLHSNDLKGENNPFSGKHHTKEFKDNRSKKVIQYTLNGELLKIWDSINECGRNGFSQGNIFACCRGKRKTHKGYIWKYLNEERDVA